MAYEFTATEFDADPDAERVAFAGEGRYVWMQRDETDPTVPVTASADARSVWVEIEDQAWGGRGGIAEVRLDRQSLTISRTHPLPRQACGHEKIVVHFDVTDDEFDQIWRVLRAI